MSRHNPVAEDENDPMRKMVILIGTASLAALFVFVGRYAILQYQLSVVTTAVSDIQANSAQSIEQIHRKAALAQRVAVERAEAEKRARAQVERERLAMQQAAEDRAEAAAVAKKAAWRRFTNLRLPVRIRTTAR